MIRTIVAMLLAATVGLPSAAVAGQFDDDFQKVVIEVVQSTEPLQFQAGDVTYAVAIPEAAEPGCPRLANVRGCPDPLLFIAINPVTSHSDSSFAPVSFSDVGLDGDVDSRKSGKDVMPGPHAVVSQPAFEMAIRRIAAQID